LAYEATVYTRIDAHIDTVWEWMSDVRNVLKVNLFHESVEWDEPITEAGPRVPVPHNFFGLKQRRVAHINQYRKYYVAFGETKAKDEPGVDPFPHWQSFELAPLSDGTCVMVCRLRGSYQFPGAKYIGERIFHRWIPPILQDDAANIAIALGALDPSQKPRLKGSLRLLQPAFTRSARYIKKPSKQKVAATPR
jgi:hypothetical protein